jgi:hypothetical protein
MKRLAVCVLATASTLLLNGCGSDRKQVEIETPWVVLQDLVSAYKAKTGSWPSDDEEVLRECVSDSARVLESWRSQYAGSFVLQRIDGSTASYELTTMTFPSGLLRSSSQVTKDMEHSFIKRHCN